MAQFNSPMGQPYRPGQYPQPPHLYQRYYNHPPGGLPAHGAEDEHKAIIAKLNAIGAILKSMSRGIGDGLEMESISHAVEVIGKLRPWVEELSLKLDLTKQEIEALKARWQPLETLQQDISAIRSTTERLTLGQFGSPEESTSAEEATDVEPRILRASKRNRTKPQGIDAFPLRRSPRAKPAKKTSVQDVTAARRLHRRRKGKL